MNVGEFGGSFVVIENLGYAAKKCQQIMLKPLIDKIASNFCVLYKCLEAFQMCSKKNLEPSF